MADAASSSVTVRIAPTIQAGRSQTCHKCGYAFNWLYWRHHCRNCGQSFCSTHSSNVLPLPHHNISEPVRVCDDCFEKQTTTKPASETKGTTGTETQAKSVPTKPSATAAAAVPVAAAAAPVPSVATPANPFVWKTLLSSAAAAAPVPTLVAGSVSSVFYAWSVSKDGKCEQRKQFASFKAAHTHFYQDCKASSIRVIVKYPAVSNPTPYVVLSWIETVDHLTKLLDYLTKDHPSLVQPSGLMSGFTCLSIHRPVAKAIVPGTSVEKFERARAAWASKFQDTTMIATVVRCGSLTILAGATDSSTETFLDTLALASL